LGGLERWTDLPPGAPELDGPAIDPKKIAQNSVNESYGCRFVAATALLFDPDG
jgi:hypothetical protein